MKSLLKTKLSPGALLYTLSTMCYHINLITQKNGTKSRILRKKSNKKRRQQKKNKTTRANVPFFEIYNHKYIKLRDFPPLYNCWE